MRVYVPLTVPLLRTALSSGSIGPAPVTAYAVTPALREWYAEGDAEELEYAALQEAARASLRCLAHDESAVRRRVVVAADVADTTVSPARDLHRAAVLVAADIALGDIASAHVDDVEAAPAIAAAATAILRADAGDEDATFDVDEAEAHELGWYATQELDSVVGEE
jgi:hypothetical protein